MIVSRKSARAQSHHHLSPLQQVFAALCIIVAAMIAHAMPASADEAYICENGRIVTVRMGELEKLALTDPCIAKYVARRSGAVATQSVAADQANPDVVTVVEVAIPLPERKPAVMPTASTGANQRHAATEIIVHHEAPPAGTTDELRPRVHQIAFRRASHHYYSYEALPTGPVDFRNVPIINATPGEPGVFHHTR